MPRKKGDFEKNDEVYDAIDEASKDMRWVCARQRITKDPATQGLELVPDCWGGHRCCSAAITSEKLDLDKERRVRTKEEMAEEAAVLRGLLPS